jgi:hypothetical protein
MLVINGKGNTFYSHTYTNTSGLQAGFYGVSFYFMNVNLPGNCAAGTMRPLSFLLEYQAQDGSWVAVGGSTTLAPLLASPAWISDGKCLCVAYHSCVYHSKYPYLYK